MFQAVFLHVDCSYIEVAEEAIGKDTDDRSDNSRTLFVSIPTACSRLLFFLIRRLLLFVRTTMVDDYCMYVVI